MRYQLTFPVTGSLVFTEHWPISVGDLKFSWNVEHGRVASLSVSAPVTESDILPTIKNSDTPGVAISVDFGFASQYDRIEHAVRTLHGLLHLFSSIDILFDSVEENWVADSEDESLPDVNALRRTITRADVNAPRPLSFELAARSILTLTSVDNFEIPLTFLRRGYRDVHAGRYIEAYYNFFFFLETLYAAGYSNPRKVKERLCHTELVIKAIEKVRVGAAETKRNDSAKLRSLIELSNEGLISHLVDVRGKLHHHAMNGPNVWHPDKAERFVDEAYLLHRIVHEIAMMRIMPALFNQTATDQLMHDAELADAVVKLRIEGVVMGGDGMQSVTRPIIYRMPGRNITRQKINHVNLQLRTAYLGEVRAYKIVSEDGVVLASYRIADE